MSDHIVIFETVVGKATVVLTTTPFVSVKDTLKIVEELLHTVCTPGAMVSTRIAPVWPNVLDPELMQEVEMTGSVKAIYEHTNKMIGG